MNCRVESVSSMYSEEGDTVASMKVTELPPRLSFNNLDRKTKFKLPLHYSKQLQKQNEKNVPSKKRVTVRDKCSTLLLRC